MSLPHQALCRTSMFPNMLQSWNHVSYLSVEAQSSAAAGAGYSTEAAISGGGDNRVACSIDLFLLSVIITFSICPTKVHVLFIFIALLCFAHLFSKLEISSGFLTKIDIPTDKHTYSVHKLQLREDDRVVFSG